MLSVYYQTVSERCLLSFLTILMMQLEQVSKGSLSVMPLVRPVLHPEQDLITSCRRLEAVISHHTELFRQIRKPYFMILFSKETFVLCV